MPSSKRRCLQLFCALWFIHSSNCANNGRFFHISDVHYDPLYGEGHFPEASSCSHDIDADQFPYGNYVCDSPWALVESAFTAMSDTISDPDFIVWTGDTPGALDQSLLANTTVLTIIRNVSLLLLDRFPNTTVYPAIGNHDNWPRHLLDPRPSDPFRDGLAEEWAQWLGDYDGAMTTFKKGGYYVTPISGTSLLMVVLNTAFYYYKDTLTDTVVDPAEQFAWLEDTLIQAENLNKTVFIIAHILPGSLEREVKVSFQPSFNEKYLEITRRFSDVIKGQFFGHHHYDSFRVMYDAQGIPTNALYIQSAITPRSTPSPRNPTFRVVTYDRDTGDVIDLEQYYLNLNGSDHTWTREYRATEAYAIPDLSPGSLDELVQVFSEEGPDGEYFASYYQHNTAMADGGSCNDTCKQLQLCAITKLDIADFEECVAAGRGCRATGAPVTSPAIFILIIMLLHCFVGQ